MKKENCRNILKKGWTYEQVDGGFIILTIIHHRMKKTFQNLFRPTMWDWIIICLRYLVIKTIKKPVTYDWFFEHHSRAIDTLVSASAYFQFVRFS